MDGRCHYCGQASSHLGLDRMSSYDAYRPGNVVCCCALCNYMKGRIDYSLFLSQCKRIASA
jgi:hypothetical protein